MKLTARCLQIGEVDTMREFSKLINYFRSIQAFCVQPFLSNAERTFYNCMIQRQQFIYKNKIKQEQSAYIIQYCYNMNCVSDDECPAFYYCNDSQCEHQPITYIAPQSILCCVFIPILIVISNRVGVSTVWIVYPILITLMAYKYVESFDIIAPVSLASSTIMMFLAFREKSQGKSGAPAINFYIVNVTMPVLIVGFNLGLVFSQIVPFLYVTLLDVFFLIILICLSYNIFKDIRSDEKITDGYFRKMLPQRFQNSSRKSNIKTNLTIQLASIQQSDSEIQQHQKSLQLSPTRKSYIRSSLLTQLKEQFPVSQLVVSLLSFLAYQCLCISLPQCLRWIGVSSITNQLIITYVIMVLLMVFGLVYLYKFYIQPIKAHHQFMKLDLGVKIDWVRVVKIGCLGFFGAIFEGFLAFGFFYFMFFYLLQAQNNLKESIATIGYFNIFISIMLTLNSVVCGNFHWLTFLIVFLLVLAAGCGCQYLFNTYLQKNIKESQVQSTLIILMIIIEICCLVTVFISFGMTDLRFGASSILQAQSYTC